MQVLMTLILCHLHGMLESWNNGQKHITSVVCLSHEPYYFSKMKHEWSQYSIIPLFHYSNRTTLRLSTGCKRSELSWAGERAHQKSQLACPTSISLNGTSFSNTGVGTRGIQFAFQLEDRPGSIKEVFDVIRRFRGRIVSILTSYQGVTDGYRKVYIRIHSIERSKLQQLKEELSRMAALIYMVDHRKNKREIY
jgi:hypothetical protein